MLKASGLAAWGLAAWCIGAGAASGQVINEATFDNGDLGGWTVNGNQMLFEHELGGLYMGIPLGTFWGVTLANSEDPALLGDLTRHGGAIRISVDIKVFTLNNFFEEPMDPGNFPIVLQVFDGTEGPEGLVSVYIEGPGMPSQFEGWTTYTFTIPDPTSLTLPPDWYGTGALQEGQLPAGRTYRSVLENATDVRLTTLRPGWFYSSNWWEAGFDNVRVEVIGGGGCPADWNGDGSINSGDISAYLTAWLQSVQGGTLDADFNGDSAVNSSDISAYLTAWLAAVQEGC